MENTIFQQKFCRSDAWWYSQKFSPSREKPWERGFGERDTGEKRRGFPFSQLDLLVALPPIDRPYWPRGCNRLRPDNKEGLDDVPIICFRLISDSLEQFLREDEIYEVNSFYYFFHEVNSYLCFWLSYVMGNDWALSLKPYSDWEFHESFPEMLQKVR